MKSKFLSLGVVLCLIAFSPACKTKQSAYKVAYEKAKEKPDIEEPVKFQEVEPIYQPPVVEKTEVKKEKITTVVGTGLKRFNVVIGSFQNKTNALSLKERMEADGFKVILVQNEAQMYRVIVATYDTRTDAAMARDDIKAKYAPTYADAWLLEQQY
jgi:cell division protein FtsN